MIPALLSPETKFKHWEVVRVNYSKNMMKKGKSGEVFTSEAAPRELTNPLYSVGNKLSYWNFVLMDVEGHEKFMTPWVIPRP